MIILKDLLTLIFIILVHVSLFYQLYCGLFKRDWSALIISLSPLLILLFYLISQLFNERIFQLNQIIILAPFIFITLIKSLKDWKVDIRLSMFVICSLCLFSFFNLSNALKKWSAYQYIAVKSTLMTNDPNRLNILFCPSGVYLIEICRYYYRTRKNTNSEIFFSPLEQVDIDAIKKLSRTRQNIRLIALTNSYEQESFELVKEMLNKSFTYYKEEKIIKNLKLHPLLENNNRVFSVINYKQ